MEATWVIDRGHREKEIPSGTLDCPGSFLIMSFSIVDKRCSEIRVQGGRPRAVTVGFTQHVEEMTESVFSKEEQKVTAEGLSLALVSIFSMITLFNMQITLSL